MAKQAGPFYFTGTIGDVVFYKLGDSYYARMQGSYNTKALQKPGARPLMQLRQQEFGRASALAKEVYWRQLPREERGRGVHSQLTRIARQLLREGKSEAEVKRQLVPLYLGQPVVAAMPAEPAKPVEQAPLQQQAPAGLKPQQPALQPVRPQQGPRVRRGLSGWKVSVKGRLYKERPVITVVSTSMQPAVFKASNCCAPCRFSGFPSSGRDGSG